MLLLSVTAGTLTTTPFRGPARVAGRPPPCIGGTGRIDETARVGTAWRNR